MITLGKLAAADRPAWAELFHGYLAFYQRELAEAEYERVWQEFLADDRLHALGARLDGQLVGITHYFVHPSTSGPDVCYLQDLFTAPAARGQGVGRALIGGVRDWAERQGCARLYWMTHETNATARRLYDQVADNRGFIRYQIELSG